MSGHPCKYLSTRKCCCCFNCDPRQVFLILSSTCLLLGLINMCSYPLCPAIIISSLVLAFYYFGTGIYLLYAVTGPHEKLLRAFPWFMLFSYIPIGAYVACLVASLDCIEKWTAHYSLDDDPESAKEMFIGIICLYSMFAVVNFLFSTYALMLSMGQLEDKSGSCGLSAAGMAQPNPYAGPFGGLPPSAQVAYATIITNTPNAEAVEECADFLERSDTLSGPPTAPVQENSEASEEVGREIKSL